jgi:amidase
MVRMADFADDDALGIAERVRRKEVTAQELADAALAAIEELNPKINAVLARSPEEARRTISAGVPDGPFAGIPFLVKEAVLQAKGLPCRWGSWVGDEVTATYDTELMTRFRQAGLVTVGTSQTPEWAYSPTTEPIRFGPTRNPWNLEHSAGGSSGGAAAAVAAGIVPIAHANDGGGSIRVPAASCGLFGLKPTRMRTPSGPDAGDPLWGLAIEFALTRSVRDAATLLDAVSAPEVGAPHMAPRPERSFAEAARRPRQGLRIAFSTKAMSGVKVHPDCVEAVNDAAALCAALGHKVEEASPTIDWEQYLHAIHKLWITTLAHGIDHMAQETGIAVGPETMEQASLVCWREGRAVTALELIDALGVVNRVTRGFAPFFETYDLFLTPALSRPPARLGEVDQNAPLPNGLDWTRRVFDYAAFTSQFNVTGQPAMCVPLHWNAAGLPVGVQFAGRFGDEATLLGLAGELEEARPWAKRRPPVHV